MIKPEAVSTSNTSGFVIEELAENVLESRKQLFAGMHFFNPVPAMKAVEIIATPQTTELTRQTVTRVGEQAGKVTGQVRDTPAATVSSSTASSARPAARRSGWSRRGSPPRKRSTG